MDHASDSERHCLFRSEPSHSGRVCCQRHHRSGSLASHRPIANIVSSPALLDSRLYVAFSDGSIRALDATNGQVIWNVTHVGGANSSPAIADGRLYIAMHNSGLLALDANSGSELWLAPMPGPQWSSPAVENGRVFVGSRDDHKVYAVRRSNREDCSGLPPPATGCRLRQP
jgi:outer membrane protein assembly factor BamB